MLSYTVDGFAVFCAIVGLICFMRIRDTGIRWLIVYTTIGAVVDVAYDFLPSLSGIPLRLYYCIAIPVQYGIYQAIFWNLLNTHQRRWGILSLTVVCLYSVYQILFLLDDRSAATNVFLVVGIISLLLVLFYFYALLQSNQVVYITSESKFWIATGLLFFLSGNLVATGLYHKFRADSAMAATAKNLYLLNYVLSIFKYILFSIAFVIAARKSPYQ